MSVRAVRKAAAARPAIAHTPEGKTLHPFPDDCLADEHTRFFSGLLLALAVSAVLWAVLAAAAYGAYLLLTEV